MYVTEDGRKFKRTKCVCGTIAAILNHHICDHLTPSGVQCTQDTRYDAYNNAPRLDALERRHLSVGLPTLGKGR